MRTRTAAGLLAAVALALAGCSSSDGRAVTTSAAVTPAPATITAPAPTASPSGSTAATTDAAPTTAPSSVTSTAGAPSTTTLAPATGWSPTAAPTWPDLTADPPPSEGPWPPGVYWAYPTALDAGPPVVLAVDISKAAHGAGVARLPDGQKPEDGCPNDYCILEPHVTTTITLTDAVSVSVTDTNPFRDFRVPLADLVKLWQVGADAKATGVTLPADFTFSNGFPLLVTVVDGRVTAIAQQWVP